MKNNRRLQRFRDLLSSDGLKMLLPSFRTAFSGLPGYRALFPLPFQLRRMGFILEMADKVSLDPF